MIFRLVWFILISRYTIEIITEDQALRLIFDVMPCLQPKNMKRDIAESRHVLEKH